MLAHQKLFSPLLALIGAGLCLLLVHLYHSSSKNDYPPNMKRSQIAELPLNILNLDANTISYRPTLQLSDKFALLVEHAMAGEGQIRILHLGDSHIQADFFTGETRRLLALWLHDEHASRGFTFPFQVAGSNNPDDYNIATSGEWKPIRVTDTVTPLNLGLAGIALSTCNPKIEMAISLSKKNPTFQPFDIISIFYDAHGMPMVPVPGVEATLLRQGDGYISYRLAEPCDSLGLTFKGNAEQHNRLTLFGFDLQNSHSKFVYHAAGVNGADVRTFLRSQNFLQYLSLVNPNLVIISLGTNDAYSNAFEPQLFAKNLQMLVSQVRKTLPEALIIITTPGDHLLNREQPNKALELLQDKIYGVAMAFDCGVWDFYRVMGGSGSIFAWANNGLTAPDMLHLNRKGYKVQGALLFDALTRLSGLEADDLTGKPIAYE